MAHIQKVGMIILMQSDLDAAVSFYKDLGFRLRFHMKEKWAEFELDTIKIGLCPTSRPAEHLVSTGIVLEVDDLYAAYKEWQGKVSFMGEPVEAVHGIMVGFKDPGGNVLDLYQPTPEKVKDLVRKTAEENPEADGCCKEDEEEEGGCCGEC